MGPIIDSDLCFDSKAHRYSLRSRPQIVLESVTQVVKQFSHPFNEKATAYRLAAERGVPAKELIAEWRRNSEAACALGTQVHECLERIVLHHNDPTQPMPDTEQPPDVREMVTAGRRWLSQHVLKPGIFSQPEVRICWPEMGLAGTIDLVYGSRSELTLVDWKTNREIRRLSQFNMHAPFGSLPDAAYWHYACQLHLYKRILQDNYGFNVGSVRLIHLRIEDGSNELYVPDLSQMVDRMLFKRKRQA